MSPPVCKGTNTEGGGRYCVWPPTPLKSRQLPRFLCRASNSCLLFTNHGGHVETEHTIAAESKGPHCTGPACFPGRTEAATTARHPPCVSMNHTPTCSSTQTAFRPRTLHAPIPPRNGADFPLPVRDAGPRDVHTRPSSDAERQMTQTRPDVQRVYHPLMEKKNLYVPPQPSRSSLFSFLYKFRGRIV